MNQKTCRKPAMQQTRFIVWKQKGPAAKIQKGDPERSFVSCVSSMPCDTRSGADLSSHVENKYRDRVLTATRTGYSLLAAP